MKYKLFGVLYSLGFVLAVQAQPVLYGVTHSGGKNEKGVLFSFNPAAGAYTRLVDFEKATGAFPAGALAQANDGKLYGVTTYGGYLSKGTIFSFNPETHVYASVFNFVSTEGSPACGLIKATDGKLYGLKYQEVANGVIIIFSFDPATAVYTKLYQLTGTDSRIFPIGQLIQARDGKLYGITNLGIFSFDPTSGIYKNVPNSKTIDGGTPAGSLMQASDGRLYGMTSYGGSNGLGTLFSFNPVTNEFKKRFDFDLYHSYPVGSLIQSGNGKLYGGTSYGAIFSFDPATSIFTDLKYVGSGSIDEAVSSNGNWIQATDGKLYTVSDEGGHTDHWYYSEGVILSIDPVTGTFAKVWDFDYISGGAPWNNGLVEYRPVAVTKQDQQITFDVIEDKKPGDTVFKLAATASSGLLVTYAIVSGPAILDGNTLTITGRGPITVHASQRGNETYFPAPNVDRTFCALTTYYRDADGDGFGNASRSATTCSQPEYFVTVKGDWNDYDPNIYPGAPELCDGRDNNQNGKIDDGLPMEPFYWDADKDGYGFRRPIYACAAPRGYISTGGDFNDNNPNIHPGAVEHCDGVDENCNGIIDDGFLQKRFYKDRDGDGWGSNSTLMSGCAPQGYVEKNGDCNDRDVTIHPGAKGSCNGKDDDCDGLVDEGCATTSAQTKAQDVNGNPEGALLQLTALPNPFQHYFTLRLQSQSPAPVQLRIVDVVGRVVEVRHGVAANTTLQMGHNYRLGVYYAQAMQASQQVSLKLVKQAP